MVIVQASWFAELFKSECPHDTGLFYSVGLYLEDCPEMTGHFMVSLGGDSSQSQFKKHRIELFALVESYPEDGLEMAIHW